MNARFIKYSAAAIFVVSVVIAAFLVFSPTTQAHPVSPETGLANLNLTAVENTAVNQMDFGQMDEKAKLEAYPHLVSGVTGQMDLGQLDETAKLDEYPILISPSTGQLDLGQMDEIAKLEK